ncbi:MULTISPECIES: inositol-3-phosphate synthase [Sphingomonas]|jgi:myo-inositol-1-phosphate synthase|uniref:Myo-inositol-1-phosphate synthase n=1 Tax=Sphingomonas aerolata TaxID=185951 RepID=A0A2T4YT62_9SPHN|nr:MULTISPECIES: inositol-3-phosphate synthase [Sphingomonas]KHA62821.1 inositol-3-phosphate synthase [Sphingomonas sp. Ant20]KQM94797.1 inositol-3-phosphate synthase [Sphingomonas sp. Leaf226]KQN22300.1 inositol-3-phosphate synthase [Sphingomonas sp. Leaf30]MBB3587340.1 myo-inositol-1-phosphate synthase [Sphingomonas sp. BK481]MBD8470582.1 inositol-3-phosphate synthase [Sphingomonas sp. CFBP 8765]
MNSIRIAVVGIGNCASSLVQGLEHYREGANDQVGLMHFDMGGYKPSDIKVVAAWDVDRRKVGKDVAEAIFAKPNCTAVFAPNVGNTGTIVKMGKTLDGVADHMSDFKDDRTFLLADAAEPTREQVIADLKASGADVLMNYLPVGSQEATEFYADCAIEAGVAFVNNIPVFIASNPVWAKKFEDAGVAIIGDDIKAQLGATIVHRVLTDLFAKRGVKLDRTYQLNTGGNTDFLNMSNHRRLESKKISKTEAVQSVAAERMDDDNVHIGPSDYVPWQNDNKVCFLRMEGQLFGGVPMNLELRLSVEDSPNSAGVAIDMIRCAKIAKDRGIAGVIDPASAYFCKHPRTQMTDDLAQIEVERFIKAA